MNFIRVPLSQQGNVFLHVGRRVAVKTTPPRGHKDTLGKRVTVRLTISGVIYGNMVTSLPQQKRLLDGNRVSHENFRHLITSAGV